MDVLGNTLGNYKVDRILGEGGMGVIYHAYDLILQREIAIKRIHPHLARNEGFRKLFIKEARAMAHLDHPGIVKVYHLGIEKDLLYLPMEFIKGCNLRQMLDDWIQAKKWMSVNEAILFVQQLCQTVEYAHQNGVLHRDIKPSNLMFKPESAGGLPYRVMLTDLGLAKLAEGLNLTQDKTSFGTPAYMSPEQASGQPLDARSDVYSLGILLYELAVEKPPFQIRTITEAAHFHVKVSPPAPRSIKREVSEALEKAILKALEKDPRKRFASAAALGSALAGLLNSTTEVADLTSKEEFNLMKEYQKSLQAPPAHKTPTDSKTRLDQGSLGPRGESIFEGGSIPPGSEPRIQAVRRGAETKFFPLPAGKVTIGRDNDNSIMLDDVKISRHHIQIVFDGMEYHVIDLKSTNGTYLDNQKLLAGVAAIWRSDQVVRIGDTWLRILEGKSKPPSESVPHSQPESSPPVHVSGGAGLIGVQVNPKELQVEPGGIVSGTFSVQNQSKNVDRYDVKLTGIPGNWVTNLPSGIPLMPTNQQETTFTLQVPRSPQSRAGEYPLILKVTSQRDPTQYVEVRLTLTVAAYSQFSAELKPKRVRPGQPARLTISNEGNSQQTFNVQLTDEDEELAFKPAQFDMPLQEGTSATQEFNVQTRQFRLMGGEQVHPFKVQVSVPMGETKTLPADTLSRGLFPVWMPPLLLLLCCALMAGAAKLISQLPPIARTPPVTVTVDAPIVEEWCVYTSDKVPSSFTNCPAQLEITPGEKIIIQWRVSNADEITITPGGTQSSSGSLTYIATENLTSISLLAKNAANKEVQKTTQIILTPFTATPTLTSTLMATATPTPTETLTSTITPTSTLTPTPTLSPTSTLTPTATGSPTFTVTASSTYTLTPSYTPLPPPIDLLDLAPSANWSSGAGGDSPGVLNFGGPDTNPDGFAMFQSGVRLEDGSIPSKVLETHPKWVDDGQISGIFPDQLIAHGTHFRAKVGFIALSDGTCGGGNVIFQLRYKDSSGRIQLLGEQADSCDGGLKSIDLDLNGLAGQHVQLILTVLANGSSGQDWAVWVNPIVSP